MGDYMVRVRIFDDLFNLLYKKAEHPLRVNFAKITRKSKNKCMGEFCSLKKSCQASRPSRRRLEMLKTSTIQF